MMAAEARENESAEKPVREQLKKASIGGREQAALEAGSTDMAQSHDELPQSSDQADAQVESKLKKKRSFEEIEEAQTGPGRHHSRKRSREGTTEGEETNINGNKRKVSGEQPRSDNAMSESGAANGEAESSTIERSGTPEPAVEKRSEDAVEALTSPKTKRSRLHSTTGEKQAEATMGAGENGAGKTDAAEAPADASVAATSENKIPPTSGFANTSSVSPFGGLAGSKSPASSGETQPTSSSAFAASGFGALAGSTTSGFGAIGKNGGGFGVGGGFGSGNKSPLGVDANKEETKSTGSAFGGALGQTSAFGGSAASTGGFGSGASGFGSGASGFGSGLGGSGFGKLGGGGLASFASGKSTPQISNAKTATSFGAPADDEAEGDGEDEDGDEGAGGIKSPLAVEEDAKDERFYEQDIETGEEGETTQYSARAKLYNYVTLDDGKKEWRERGLGILRLNVQSADYIAEEQKTKARFLMRADGSHRVVLNTPIKKEITVGKPPDGGPPTNGYLYFMGTIGDSSGLELLQLKMRQQFALEVYEKVKDLQSDM